MHLLCPHCHSPIELADLASQKEIVCPSCGSSFQLERGSTTTDWRPRKLGKFDLLEEVGIGAFGTVYKARDPELDRIVAIKVPRAGNLPSSADLDRFLREARSVAQLRHHGIVPIHEVGQQETVPYLVSDFVQGITLADQLAVRRPGFREAAELIAAVADALQYAHEHGVVHRDVKPSNIMLESVVRNPSSVAVGSETSGSDHGLRTTDYGLPKLMDFGLAKREAGEITMTLEGQVLGTPAYMSPEQARGEAHKVDGRSDVYSLGVILYLMLTGELPFRGNTRMLLHQVLHDEPRSPRSLNDRIPRDLETICLKAMAKEAGRRYATARDLADELRRCLRGEPIQARPVSVWERSWSWAERRPAVAGLLAALVVVVMGSLLGLTGLWLRAEERRVAAVKAKEEEGRAKDAEEKAKDQAQKRYDEARLRWYISDMNLAEQAWKETKVGRMQELVERWRPRQADDMDFRGFEWYHLWHLCPSDHLTLRGHTGPVHSVAFSPDGKRLASAGQDGTVRVWDAATGRESLTLQGRTRQVISVAMGGWASVAFSPDGKHLASAHHDGTVRVWDARTGQETLTLKGHPGQVFCVTFSPNGKRLASAGGEFGKPGEVKVWEATTGQGLLTLKGYTGGVSSVAFSPDGKRLASAHYDGSVRVWDAATGQETLTFQGHTNIAHSVAFSPDGKRLASAGGDVKVWDAATGKEIFFLQGRHRHAMSVVFSPDGKRLASAGQDVTPMVWDAITGKETLPLKGHTGWVMSVAFSPDGKRLASASDDGTVRVWNAGSDQEPLTLYGHTGTVYSVPFSPNGKHLASASLDGTVKVWDAGTGQETLTLLGPAGPVESVAFRPDGKCLASAHHDGTVRVWDARTGQETLILKGHVGSVRSVAFRPDGKRLASTSDDGTVRVWDAVTGQETLTLNGHKGMVHSVAFGPDGKRLASAGFDGTVRVWDPVTGEEIIALRGHTGLVKSSGLDSWVMSVAFSPDGKSVASASLDGTVRVWDAATGQEALTLKGHTGQVFCVTFSPDGKRLASASADETVKVWDAATGQETLTLQGHGSEVMAVAFSPDGQRLASATGDGPVKVWETTAPTPEELRKRRAVALVRELFETLDAQVEVVAHLRQDQFLSEPFKSELVALAKAQRPNPLELNKKSWAVVREANPGAAARRALRQAREACRLKPDKGVYLTTLGVALYRARQYQAALETLTRSEKLNTATYKTAVPADIAFLAMAEYQLGQKEKAQASLERLREILKQPKFAKDQEAQGFLREAETLLKEQPSKPKK